MFILYYYRSSRSWPHLFHAPASTAKEAAKGAHTHDQGCGDEHRLHADTRLGAVFLKVSRASNIYIYTVNGYIKIYI